jgi:hypothetical protein
MSTRQRIMSVLTLTGCLVGLVGIPLGWGAHPPTQFCRTADECPDLRWPAGTAGLAAPPSLPEPTAP